ncbi:MAG: SAM-dependent chlorinase/fluorinase [Chlorobiaceae bacterium]|jgi:S-adenosyl-L-methionine hydrolase (adenosine-forming)|nr:SAM-dependent chlorinase/fluorinase [Chlorobiaceae bacterium]
MGSSATQQDPVIALLTDFGLSDTYVGQMKGVILSICPKARIIDLTHDVAPQNILQGMFLLERSIPFFPEKTIFVCIVDPGVGTARNPLAIVTARNTFIGPDNGILTPAITSEKTVRCITITNREFMLPEQSNTFHGRDIFSPAAAHLASGVSAENLGHSIDPETCIRLTLPVNHIEDRGTSVKGQVLFADHFGNLVTSIEEVPPEEKSSWNIETNTIRGIPLSSTYGAVADQEMVAYCGSYGVIEIGMRNGNAAHRTGLKSGDPVRLVKRKK